MSDNTERIRFNKPPLFSPTVTRTIRETANDSSYSTVSNLNSSTGSAIGTNGNFKFNPIGNGLVSTQQLNVDWSEFSNHTFYNSAQVKTNVAYDKIINEFPFDGTKEEIDTFLSKLTGFEKWVFDQFEKNKSYFYFSGSASGSHNGSAITVKDFIGAQYSALSRNTSGQSILDPGTNSMTIEFFINVPNLTTQGNLTQTILYKSSGSNGFAVVLDAPSASLTPSVSFMVVSGGLQDKVSLNVSHSGWTHVSWIWDRTPGANTIYSYKDLILQNSSSVSIEFGAVGTVGSDLILGSGSNLGTHQPSNTFSGSIDELRIWQGIRTLDQLKKFKEKAAFNNGKLNLYFKFNEPSGSNSDVVLDYSGKSLHGKVNSFVLNQGLRELDNPMGISPMTFENINDCPVLFPQTEANIEIRSELLLSASIFDEANPNIITKLIPKHYLEEGQEDQGFDTEEGQIVNAPTTDGINVNPKENKLGSTQVLLSLLYTWAKFFDEMKLYIQAFGTLKTLNYNEYDTIPNDFLSIFAKNEGIELPPLFSNADIEQFVDGENLDNIISKNTNSLSAIQNQIWKRILINMRDFISSKGTIHSLKSFLRSTGVDPDSNFRIREYGGATKRPLVFNRENRKEISSMLNFVSGGIIKSPFLLSSASRIEPGWPEPGPDDAANMNLTSGSFTFEATYRFPVQETFKVSQSLVRFFPWDDVGEDLYTGQPMMTNLVSTDDTITLYARPNPDTTLPALELALTGVNIQDGENWYVSFGRIRNDQIGSRVSSSYFIRAAKQNYGEIVESYSTSSFYYENTNDTTVDNYWQLNIPTYFLIGSSSFNDQLEVFLATGSIAETAKEMDFKGKISQIRFWSKFVEETEWREHVRNFRSVGVQDPKKHFNFVGEDVSGSWNRLRIDASTDQIVTMSNNFGQITLTDFTQNQYSSTFFGIQFPVTKSIIEPEIFYYSYLSPKVDIGVQENKVRIRGYQDESYLVDRPWAQLAPVNEILYFEQPSDDVKLSIDFSVIDTLDQDIITIFSSLDELNNILGSPEYMFSSEYKDLETLREIYFNKLEDKISFKAFFDFYKWFDTNLGTFVEQMLPRKTKFLGSNFLIESHILERAKIQYQFEDIYLGEDIRSGLKDTILLQLIAGSFSKY